VVREDSGPAAKYSARFDGPWISLEWRRLDFFPADLQIPRSSLIIISLLGDAARFRRGISCFKFIFSVDRIAVIR
jgi:hypothetical protein